jgi:hypothetical protein
MAPFYVSIERRKIMGFAKCPICGSYPQMKVKTWMGESCFEISCCGYSVREKTQTQCADKWRKLMHDREQLMSGSLLKTPHTKGVKDMNGFEFKVKNINANNFNQEYSCFVEITPRVMDTDGGLSSTEMLSLGEYIEERLNGGFDAYRKRDVENTREMKLLLNSIYGVNSFKNRANRSIPQIVNVIFNNPATIVMWSDGTKTIVKAQDGETYDPEKGLALAISKKALGNQGNYYNEFDKWLKEEENNA